MAGCGDGQKVWCGYSGKCHRARLFLTEQNRNLLTNADGSLTDRGQLIIRGTPFGRFGEPDELSGTLLWLCSDASKFVSGIVVPVDGAFSAYGEFK